VIGIGTDLVELDRFRLALQRTPRLAERLFSDAERAYAARQQDPTERLAVRFAAKEAVMKAMGVGLWKFPMRDIEVIRAESGAPAVRLHGEALRVAESRGVTQWRLTMTHTDRVAQAIAVAL
jgi:holo-[acyl-carrier protein] synthase